MFIPRGHRDLLVAYQTHPGNQASSRGEASNAEEAEVERFYEDLQDLLELPPKKDVLFIIGVRWNQETDGFPGAEVLMGQEEAGHRRAGAKKCIGGGEIRGQVQQRGQPGREGHGGPPTSPQRD